MLGNYRNRYGLEVSSYNIAFIITGQGGHLRGLVYSNTPFHTMLVKCRALCGASLSFSHGAISCIFIFFSEIQLCE